MSYAAEIGADSALAFAPQYCPHPDRFPEDTRWAEARARIPEFSRPSLHESMRSTTQYTLLHGRWSAEDSLHWQAFPQGSNIDHFWPIAKAMMLSILYARRGRCTRLSMLHGGKIGPKCAV